MTESNFRIKYSGEEADEGTLHLRDYSKSMEGLERILHCGIALSESISVPTGKEINKTYSLHVRAPQKACFEQLLVIAPLVGVTVLHGSAQVFISYLWSWVGLAIKRLSGRNHRSELSEVIDLLNNHTEVMGKAIDTVAQANASLERVALQTVDLRLPVPAQNFTRPLTAGRARYIEALDGSGNLFTIDQEMAASITVEDIWSEPEEFRTVVVGVLRPEKRIEISHPDLEGFIQAEVADPAFEDVRNIYLDALVMRTALILIIKIRRHQKSQKLMEITVLHATKG